jgi:phosphoserine phosphatase
LTDRSFLSSVGHAHVVNAGRDVAAVANEKNWMIWHWQLAKRVDVNPDSRVAAGMQQVGEGL